MRCVLALDQSTSATKALLFDESGRCLDQEVREHRQHYPQPGWVEHDAEEIWLNALCLLRSIVRRNEGLVGDLLCLSIANQRETVVIFDRADGRPLHRAIVWQCRRGDGLCEAQRAAGREAAIRRRTGLPVDAYFSASKLQWLGRNQPELKRRLACGEALIGTIDAYLIYRLTGGAVFATDCTNASRTLLYDIASLEWDDELCAWWEVPRTALPEVRESFAAFGVTTLGGALPRPLPIRGVMGDSQASLFGQRCFDPGDAKVTLGTGASVMLNIGATPAFSAEGVVTALAWVRGGVPTYALEGIIISAASSLTWLRDRLGLFTGLGEPEAMARELADNEGVYLVPAFSGLGLPHWQPEARAAITGLSGHSDRRHVVRAALEAVAYQLGDVIAALRAETAVPLRALRADGGPTANRFLMQFIADLTGVELRVATTEGGSALGAAMAGMIGAGVHASTAVLKAIPAGESVYIPAMDPARAERLRAGWRRAVQSVLPAAGPRRAPGPPLPA
jgi:glycerol kinase